TVNVTFVLPVSPVVGLVAVMVSGKFPVGGAVVLAPGPPPQPARVNRIINPTKAKARRRRTTLPRFLPMARPAIPSSGNNAAYSGGVVLLPGGRSELELATVTVIVTVVLNWLVDAGLKVMVTPGGTAPVKPMLRVPSPLVDSTSNCMEVEPPGWTCRLPPSELIWIGGPMWVRSLAVWLLGSPPPETVALLVTLA